MRGKEVITKLIIPGIVAVLIGLIVRPMCMNNGILDWRTLLLFVGIPFGIQKMFLWVVPRNMGIGEMIGLTMFNLMLGSVIGTLVFFWRMIITGIVLLKSCFGGIIWIVNQSKGVRMRNEGRTTGKIV